MKRLIASVLSIVCVGAVSAQNESYGGPINNPSPNVIDGVVIQQHIPTKRLIPYEFVREADMVWSKRIWRAIDLREKINIPLYYPFDDHSEDRGWTKNATRWSLWTVFATHILNGDLTLYRTENPNDFQQRDGDSFKYPLAPPPGKNYYTDSLFGHDLFYRLGKDGVESDVALANSYGEDSLDMMGNPVYPPVDKMWYNSTDIVQYRLKEDWFFDKERSVLDVRIMGISPVVYDKNQNGAITGFKELFWLYFPACRFVMNNYFVYNDKNDSQWMSFDDLFWKRQFNSTIIKQSNTYDRTVETYKMGVDALMESNRITEEIRIIEHDVWSL